VAILTSRLWATIVTAVGAGACLGLAPQRGAAQEVRRPHLTETVLELEGGGQMRYAISLPPAYDPRAGDARPLVLALHPGGRSEYYGSWFLQTFVEPALRRWEAVIVAPDVPDERWSTERSERALLALLDETLADHAIDRSRVLITGFSMGGRGTWYMATRHPDLFTGAIVVAAGPGEESLENLAALPLYIIHSPDDEVVPYGPVARTAALLAERGYPVHMARLPGATHHRMAAYVGPLSAAGDWMREQWRARPSLR
jgi:predicted peptidase